MGLSALIRGQEFPAPAREGAFRAVSESFPEREEAGNGKGLLRSCHPKSLVILKLITSPCSSDQGTL